MSVPVLGGPSQELEFQKVLDAQGESIRRSRCGLCVPQSSGLMQRRPGMHYHFRPEIFVQTAGAARFAFPHEELYLRAGEALFLPTGLPHAETPVADDEGQFQNLVIGFYSSTVSMHFAVDAGRGRPEIGTINFFPTPDLGRIVGLVDLTIGVHQSTASRRKTAVEGMASGLFAMLADLTRTNLADPRGESRRIFQVKWLVRDQLYNPDLNVTFIAHRLGCSPDYLSAFFHKQTGETLIHYLHRQRMSGAIEMLGRHELSISEISWACGYADAGYFTRVFRKHTGMTPQAYRQQRLEEVTGREARPKTVYHDREDFSPGAPVAVAGQAVEKTTLS